ncbi:MAG TPA: glycosyltransferase [Gemmatimonadales bacterium]|nr:glycosyltransferase [Gemmatimonadales bacterium]
MRSSIQCEVFLRVVVIGAGRKHKNEAAVARAVRSLGHACTLVNAVTWTQNLGRLALPLLMRQVESFEPDVVILGRHATLMGEERLKKLIRGRYSAFWYFDLRVPPIQDVLTLGRMVDAMFVTYLPTVETYRSLGVSNVLYLPQGMDPELDRPAQSIPRRYHCEMAFIGGNSPHRNTVLRAMARAYDLQIRGPGWRQAPPDLPVRGGPVYRNAYAQAVGGAAISLGAHSLPDMAYQTASASNRMWKVMGCSGFYLGEWVSGIEALGADGVHCVWYRSLDDGIEKARYYLDHPAERRGIAEAGRRHALGHHTYAHRVQLLLEGRGYSLRQTIS